MYTKNEKAVYAGKIYVVTLNEKNLNVFDFNKDNNTNILNKWTSELIDYVKSGIHDGSGMDPIKDVLVCFYRIVKFCFAFMDCNFDEKRYFDYHSDTVRSDDVIEKAKTLIAIINKLRKSYPEIIKIIEDNPYENEWDLAMKIRTKFCEDLIREGYNAFYTQEITGISRSDKCYGILDKSALETLSLIPLDKDLVEDALNKLKTNKELISWYKENRNYTESNAIIHAFMNQYKKQIKS